MDDHGRGNEDWRIGKTVAQCNRYMLLNELHCDVTFIVGEEKRRILAHKHILISRSEVFEAMLVGLLHEHSNEIQIPDVSPSAFRKLLEFMYYDYTKIEEEETYELLYVARKYLVMDLVHRCLQRLKTKMSVDNVCIILSYADDEGTVNLCLTYIFRYPHEVLMSEGFRQLRPENIKQIISSNKLSVEEENVFDAIISWSEQECMRQEIEVLPENQGRVLGDIFRLVRYGTMNRDYVRQVCKRYLPTELYVEIIENIALQSEREINILQSEDATREEIAGAMAAPTRHPGGACGQEFMSSFTPRHFEEQLDSIVMSDCEPVELTNSRDQVPSVFTGQSDLFDIYRFYVNANASGKSYEGQVQDSISFIASGNVELVGVLMYGSCGSPGVYQIHLEILQDLNGHLSLVHSSEHEVETDGSTKHYKLNIRPSLHIEPDNVYTIRALIRGPPSYFGTNGITEVRKNGISVWFISNDDGFGLNTTTAEGGQFPGLIFKKRV